MLTSNSPVCVGNTLLLNAFGGGLYNWTGPNSFTSAAVSPTIGNVTLAANGVYSMIATVGSCTAMATLSISIVSNPTLSAISNNTSVCGGQPATLTASGANSYTWTGIGAGPTVVVNPTVTTNYTVTGTGTNNCQGSAITSISVNPLPNITATTNNTLLCLGQSATLTASGANTYTWSSGGINAGEVISPTVTTNYTVTGTGANNCSNSFVITQSVTICSGLSELRPPNTELIVFPNPFNAEVTISTKGSSGIAKLSIINALGQEVYVEYITEPVTKINLADLSKGLYFVRFSGQSNQNTIKLVKD